MRAFLRSLSTYASGRGNISYNEEQTSLPEIVSRIRRVDYGVPIETAVLEVKSLDADNANATMAALLEVVGVKDVRADLSDGTLSVSLYPIGLDSRKLLQAGRNAGVWAELRTLCGGDEEQEMMRRLKMLRLLIISALLTMPLVWDIHPYAQLILATLIQIIPGMYFFPRGIPCAAKQNLYDGFSYRSLHNDNLCLQRLRHLHRFRKHQALFPLRRRVDVAAAVWQIH